MANRIIVATLFQCTYTPPGGSSTTVNLLNISPRTLETFTQEDNIFLVVKAGAGVPTPSTPLTWSISYTLSPFSPGLPTTPTPGLLDTVYYVGTLSTVSNLVTLGYTLTVVYDGNTYTEDPQIRINPNP